VLKYVFLKHFSKRERVIQTLERRILALRERVVRSIGRGTNMIEGAGRKWASNL